MDSLFALAFAAVFLGGLVRGFSGFGAALVMTPLLALIYTPLEAVVYASILSLCGTIFLFGRSLKQADKTTAFWLLLGSLPTLLLGNAALLLVPAGTMRVFFALVIIALSLITLAGFIYRGAPRRRLALMVGGLGGFMYGSVGAGGTPSMIYLTGTDDNKSRARATVVVHATLCLILSILVLGLTGSQLKNLFLMPDWPLLGLLLGGHFGGVYAGELLFHWAGDQHYERTVLWGTTALGFAALYLSLS